LSTLYPQSSRVKVTRTSVTAFTQLAVMRILGEAVQYNGGGGTICHLWWYGKHTKLSASVMAMNATTENTDVMRSIQICQRSEKMRQYSRSTMALRLNIRTMLSPSALASHK
jgi:hypothetical protein